MKMSKGTGKSATSGATLQSGLSEHSKISGCCEGKHVSGQVGGNNTPTKTTESVSANGRHLKIG